jgi:hypothetical protein
MTFGEEEAQAMHVSPILLDVNVFFSDWHVGWAIRWDERSENMVDSFGGCWCICLKRWALQLGDSRKGTLSGPGDGEVDSYCVRVGLAVCRSTANPDFVRGNIPDRFFTGRKLSDIKPQQNVITNLKNSWL